MNSKEDDILRNRLIELANRSYRNNIFTFTEFLSMADASLFYSIENEIKFAKGVLWGGNESCERKVLRFGDSEEFGYEEAFPIEVLCVKPLMDKFADELTHRDILGALMNLGIERNVLGDIFLKDNRAYVYCLSSIADYICENLTRIKHTSVMCSIIDEEVIVNQTEIKEFTIQIQSERIDGVIAKIYKLSRSQVIPLFKEKKIFVNGRGMENNSYTLKNGDSITVRGFGRCEYIGVEGTSRKGKLNAKVRL